MNFIEIVQSVIVLLLGGGIFALFRMSNTCIRLETWQENHQRMEDLNKTELAAKLDKMDHKLDREAVLAAALNNLADAVKSVHRWKAEQQRRGQEDSC